jgi:condensin complex subunit 2
MHDVPKKVDVQELKRVLWQEIEALPGKSTPFSTLVSGLGATSMPKEMLSDVSVPYCFICLLHLANEHNLDLQAIDHELLISAQ